MKVLEEATKGVARGETVALAALDLPVVGTSGLLIVFWKER